MHHSCNANIILSVSSNELRGTDDNTRAQIIQWMNYSDNEILPPVSALCYPYMGIIEFNKQVSYIL